MALQNTAMLEGAMRDELVRLLESLLETVALLKEMIALLEGEPEHQPKPAPNGLEPPPEIDRLINMGEVADLLGCAKTTIYGLLNDGQFVKPILHVGRQRKWRKGDVIDWMHKQRTRPDKKKAATLPDPSDRLINMEEVAAMLGCAPTTVFYMAKDGRFVKPLKVGRLRRWLKADVITWMNEQRAQPKKVTQRAKGRPRYELRPK
jgi:prophage regulatory protein